jgi:two-component system, chemotaxis family, chemotaxis protein CheY
MLALVIDDSRAMRSILSRKLDSLGFDVETASDGAEGLALVRRGPLPDVALVDWNMPVMDGLDFVAVCRKDSRLRKVTLMMVTTESEQSQIVRALAAGAHEYLIKPFTRDALVEKLDLLGLGAA